MSEAKEVTVILKDSEKSTRHKFLIYEEFTFSTASPIIAQCIAESRKSFEGEPEKCTVKANLEVQ